MALKMLKLESREDWLKHRHGKIGGSDAAAVLGLNPYKSNVDLWREKTGVTEPEDISDKPFVKYGTEAETYLRSLFMLDFPEYRMEYVENNLFINDKYPFAHASLDGWLTDSEGRLGVWECKTTNIQRSGQKSLWNGRIPDNYYIQVLHYLLVTEYDFAILKAQLKFDIGGEIFLQTKHYKIEREDVQDDIEILEEAERKFYGYMIAETEPSLQLPEL